MALDKDKTGSTSHEELPDELPVDTGENETDEKDLDDLVHEVNKDGKPADPTAEVDPDDLVHKKSSPAPDMNHEQDPDDLIHGK
ncbi:MAG: hypothetical protein JWQ27_1607 [Ferruginibacter sp.]|nr:hypothetical protein [Ferruginibacter sp.]